MSSAAPQSSSCDDLIFLETTVQADRTTSSHPKRQAIAAALNNKSLVSSTYVLGEYKATFLRDTVTFHKLLVDSESVSVALNRFERYGERQSKRLLRIFALIYEDGVSSKEDMLTALEILIEWQLARRFMHGLDQPLLNESGCQRAAAQPVRSGEIYEFPLSCTQSPPPSCDVESLVGRRTQELAGVAAGIPEQDSDLRKVGVSLGDVLEGKRKPHGNVCRNLSDLLIALEAPPDAIIATTNIRHFEPLCRLLGRPDPWNPLGE